MVNEICQSLLYNILSKIFVFMKHHEFCPEEYHDIFKFSFTVQRNDSKIVANR